jgi:hypothetical protein
MGVGTTRGAIQTALDGVIAHHDLSPDQILSARINAAYGVWAAARLDSGFPLTIVET